MKKYVLIWHYIVCVFTIIIMGHLTIQSLVAISDYFNTDNGLFFTPEIIDLTIWAFLYPLELLMLPEKTETIMSLFMILIFGSFGLSCSLMCMKRNQLGLKLIKAYFSLLLLISSLEILSFISVIPELNKDSAWFSIGLFFHTFFATWTLILSIINLKYYKKIKTIYLSNLEKDRE